MNIDFLIKELDKNIIVEDTKIEDNCIYIKCSKPKYNCKCPYCGQKSSKIHSIYTRTIKDLPIQNHEVKLVLNVKKYFCINNRCKHTTFAEPFDFVEPKAVRTNRLTEYVSRIGLRNSSMDTARDLKDNSINLSVWTVLRIIKKKSQCHI